ncbi:MAG: InlB B-repeat-containing protein [Candidatus Methanomethylophilaceae archaeon]|nr:InlB B-repeat-containing protein [Candidatus Methanomethylophilaceae archaeon]
MNKTMAFIAVVLTMVTAFFVIATDGSDGAVPSGYVEITDANNISYTDETLPGTNIYISSASVKAEAFKGCTSLVNVVLDDNVRMLGDRAFEGCTGLASFKAPGLKNVGYYCFKDTGAVNFDFSTKLTVVGAHAFENCKGPGPYLLNTSVSEIKSGTYLGSKIQIEDLRNVTSIATDAFSEGYPKGQLLNDGQASVLTNVPTITLKDVHLVELTSTYNSNSKEYKLTFYTGSSNAVFKFTDSNGTTTATTAANQLGGSCYYYFNGQSLRVEGGSWTIHFPEITGLDDDMHISGEGTYQIPYPNVASNLFKSWKIKGESTTRTTITESEFAKLGSDIYLEITYLPFTVTYDHSALSDSSGLPARQSFNVGDSYPELQSVSGYDFTGWYVGNEYYEGGSKITTFRDHTAVSSWNANTFTVSVMSEGVKIGSKMVAANTELRLSELSVTAPESKRFMGWSLESNGAVLSSDPVISGNCSIYAVYEDRSQFTIRYLDGDTVLGTIKAYDGDTVYVQQDNPMTEGKTFQNWKLGDTESKLYRGDSIRVVSDMDLHAIWLTDKKTVKYVLDDSTKTETFDYGETVIVGCSTAAKSGFTLQGWGLSSTGSILYHDGDSFIIKNDTKLYPIWAENGKFTVTLHDHDGKTTVTKVEQNTSYTLPSDSGWAQHIFDGWATAADGPVNFRTGDSSTITKDTDFFEIWHLDPAQSASGEDKQEPEKEPSTPGDTKSVEDSTSTDEKKGSGNEPIEKGSPSSGDETPAETQPQAGSTSPSKTPAEEQPSGEAQPQSGSTTTPETPAKEQSSSGSTKKDDSNNTPSVPSTVSLRFMDGTSLIAAYDLNLYTVQDLSVAGTPSKTGYKFLGWSENSKAQTATLTSQSTKMILRNTTLYAVWEKLLAVNYHEGSSTDTVYCGKDEQIVLKIVLKEGSEFIGWTENGSSTVLKDRITVSKDMDLYPKWETKVVDTTPIDTGISSDFPQTVVDSVSENGTPMESSSGGDSSITMIGIGAAVAAIVSSIVIFQLRRS